MSEIAKIYAPDEVEQHWQEAWEKASAFHVEADETREPFTIMIPPPNVTGVLHIGHVLNNTLQDIFVRRARLEGKAALWFPGTDHAGIATQTKVEKILREETGQTRHDLGREAFLQRVWQFRESSGGTILRQLRSLGASCDWERTTFTLDDHYARAVLASFVKLWERGYIYRGRRMVNWDPAGQTALSDEEVVMKEQNGTLFHMRYELVTPTKGLDGELRTHLEIATTRPETIMGDTAVAVHPEDPRYAHLIGQKVWRPFPRAAIPIIGDSAVEREFGTGCLKVTPAHDATDFAIGQRHNLPVVDVFNPDGTLNALAGEPFVGMERFAARRKAAELLESMGLLIRRESYQNKVGYSDRTDVPIEPRLSAQWFLRYPKVREAIRAVENGQLQFHPKRWEKVFLHWLQNIQDWCISRQLWWGHRIPVWYRKGLDRAQLTEADYRDPQKVHVSVDGPHDPENWVQDEDVLDTWASSNLWPIANFGWPDFPDGDREFRFFYPTTILITAFEIIFFWVARMIMTSLELVGEQRETLEDEEIARRLPFRHVYIHQLIRDERGRKMSKSLGNSPDPLDLIQKFGADGLRFGIVSIAPKGNDILFKEERLESGRNFCNKIWNACRFRQMSGPMADNQSLDAILARIQPAHLDRYDHWILSRLVETLAELESGFANWETQSLTTLLLNFFRGDFCDWYVEASKAKLRDPQTQGTVLAVQDLVIRLFLQMAHPFLPHITEELWNALGFRPVDTSFIHESRLPSAPHFKAKLVAQNLDPQPVAVAEVADLNSLVTAARALKAEQNMGSKRDLRFFLITDERSTRLLGENRETLLRLIGASGIDPIQVPPEGAPAALTPLGTLSLDLLSGIDPAAERARLANEMEKLDKYILSTQARLANPGFSEKAPAKVIEGARRQLQEALDKRDELRKLVECLPV